MNSVQISALIRSMILVFAAGIAGAAAAWGVAHCGGCIAEDQVLAFLNGPFFGGLITAVVTIFLSILNKSTTNMINQTAKLTNPNGSGTVTVITDPKTANEVLKDNPSVISPGAPLPSGATGANKP